ncbi:hypothetical protein HYV64_04975 [Candidatus Shapirobacteria bacterium]|nr:hypothetical protein [Candidatus Shapirobacteria bacterium]
MTEKTTNIEHRAQFTEISKGAENFVKGQFDYDTLTFLSKVSRGWEMTDDRASRIISDRPLMARYYNDVVAPETNAIITELDKMDRVSRAVCLYMSYAAERNVDQALLNADSARLFCDTAELFDKIDGKGAGDNTMIQAKEYDDKFYLACTGFALHFGKVKEMAEIDIETFETVVPEKGTAVWRWEKKIRGE